MTIEMSASCRVGPSGRYDLNELIPESEQRIFEAELRNTGIAVRDLQTELVLSARDGAGKIVRGQYDLTDAQTHLPSNFGARFSTNARAPSL